MGPSANLGNVKQIFLNVFLTVHPCKILKINPTRCATLLGIFIFLLYMFPVSGLLVGVKLQPADQTPPIQSDKYKCRIGTVISPDDGHMVARNM